MAQVNAKCTNCNQEILIDDQKDADICPYCNTAFVSEKAIKLYNYDPEGRVRSKKRRHIFKSFLMGFWMAIKCIFYLVYVFMFLWLFFDIVDGITKKK